MTTQPQSPLTMLLSRHTRRREFITLLSGATIAWPIAVNAQQPERLRRIGILMNRAADNPEGQDRLAAFHQGLQELGSLGLDGDDLAGDWRRLNERMAACE
jgi:hypothetical protein